MYSTKNDEGSTPEPSDVDLYNQSFLELHEFFLSFRPISLIYERTNLPPSAVFFVFFSIIAYFFSSFFGVVRFIQILGFVGPAYVTVRALDGDDEVDLLRWIKYWVIFSISVVCEPVSDMVWQWSDHYFPLKVLYWVWICTPFTNSTSILYDLLLSPFFTHYRTNIDQSIDVVKYQSIQASRELRSMSSLLIRNASSALAVAALSGLTSNTPTNNGKGYEVTSKASIEEITNVEEVVPVNEEDSNKEKSD